MSIGLDEYAHRSRLAGAALGEAACALRRIDPGRCSFGAGAPGRLGVLGRSLHDQFVAALHARQREAAAHADRLTEMARSLTVAAATAREVDRGAAVRCAGVDGPAAGRGGAAPRPSRWDRGAP